MREKNSLCRAVEYVGTMKAMGNISLNMNVFAHSNRKTCLFDHSSQSELSFHYLNCCGKIKAAL